MDMIIRWMFAAIHLLALGIGLGAVWARSRALRQSLDAAGLQRVFTADAWWGIAALLWLSTGLVRLFGALEKTTSWYFHNHVFLLKMALFLVIVVLELAPMRTFIRWRAAVRRGELPDTTRAMSLSRVSALQAALVMAMVFAATAVTRGLGAR
jgi:putative membrane protein